jgi:shikimate kinase/3-dehydroquinate synthase
MDVVLVGLPGSGKSAVGRRLASRHGATLIDLDQVIEREAGARIPEIFEAEGEAGFRARERAAVTALGSADPDPRVRRVIAPGGGAVVDPRNRWALYRGRLPIWLDVRPEVLAQRLRRSPNVRPLVAGGRDPLGTIRDLGAARARFYRAAHRVNAVSEPGSVLAAVEALVERGPDAWAALLDAETTIGRIRIGAGSLAADVGETLGSLGAARAVLVSEPVAWRFVGEELARALREAGRDVVELRLPEGEAAKRLGVVEAAARELAAARVERGEPLVAIGGGALGDPAGLLASLWQRGVPIVQVPTTLVAQIDSAIGGKTAVDLPEGKNLLGAFHQPAAVLIDVSVLRTLPARHLRAALGEAVKMGVLGDERLLELLELRGPAIAAGVPAAFEDGAVAELVERCAWAKVEVVSADERESGAEGGRVTLNLGHSYGHALEAAAGYEGPLHGEAVAYGLRGACRLGVQLGTMPAARAARIEALLDRLELATEALPYPVARVLEALHRDKKHAGGALRWVLPTDHGVEIRTDVPESLVTSVLVDLLAGRDRPGSARPDAGVPSSGAATRDPSARTEA